MSGEWENRGQSQGGDRPTERRDKRAAGLSPALDARDSPRFPDVFILDNVVETGSPDVWQSIVDRVRAGGGVLVLAGPDFQPGQSIGKVLNGTVGRPQAGTFTPELTAEGGVLPWWGASRAQGHNGRDAIDLAGVPPFTGLRPLNPDGVVWLDAQENRVPLVVAGKAGKGTPP